MSASRMLAISLWLGQPLHLEGYVSSFGTLFRPLSTSWYRPPLPQLFIPLGLLLFIALETTCQRKLLCLLGWLLHRCPLECYSQSCCKRGRQPCHTSAECWRQTHRTPSCLDICFEECGMHAFDLLFLLSRLIFKGLQ